jgi:hypothetical protein
MNICVRRFPLVFLSAALLLAQQGRGQTSVATNPVGYNMFSLPAGNSVRVNTFVQPTAYEGTAASYTSGSTSVVTLSGDDSALTSAAYDETTSGPAYYMEVLSTGSAQGLIVDVISNTASTITVNANLSTYAVSGTTSFCIRPHTTLSSLFPATTTALTPYVDSIKLFFPNNTSESFLFTGTGDGWITGGGADAGGQIIYPGQGFIMTVQSAKSVPVSGCVKPGPTQVALYAGAINLVGTINPILSGTQTLSTYNFPAVFTPYVDAVKLFNDTGLLQSPGSYLSTGTDMISGGTGLDADTVSVNPSNAVLVTVGQSKLWVMPSFYTSGD